MILNVINISFLFWFKLIIILSLFILNIYLYFKDNSDNVNSNLKALESGIGGKRLRQYLAVISGIGGIYSTTLSIKADRKAKLQEELDKMSLESQNSEVIKRMNEIIQSKTNLEIDIINYQERVREGVELIVKGKKYLQSLDNNDKNKFNSVNNEYPDSEILNALRRNELDYDRAFRSFLITNKEYFETHPELKSALDKEYDLKNEINQIESSPINTPIETGGDHLEVSNESSKSSLFSWILETFESLDTFSKLALSLLLLKSALVSCLISIVFIFYGDYLINKYKIDTRFPRLAKIIILRKKFNRYYLILNCSMVAVIIFIEVFFCLSVLLG